MTEGNLQKIRMEAESWKGTPFWFGQCKKGVGGDCGNVVIEIFKVVKPELKHPSFDEILNRTPEEASKWVLEHYDLTFVDTPEPGDLCVFIFGRGKRSRVTFAILLDKDELFSCSFGAGCHTSVFTQDHKDRIRYYLRVGGI